MCRFCLESLLPSSDRLRKRPARSGIRFGYPSPREGYFRHRRISGSTPIGVPFLFGLLLSLRTRLHEAERFAESGSVSPLKRRGSLLTRAKRANFRHRRISGGTPIGVPFLFGIATPLFGPRSASALRVEESGSVHEPKAHITAAGNITPSYARHITPSRARHITRHRRISGCWLGQRYDHLLTDNDLTGLSCFLSVFYNRQRAL